jgi:hypothetical protein
MKDMKFYIGFVLSDKNDIMYSHVTTHKLIAQMDAIVNMITLGNDESLRNHLTAYVFDTEEEKVINGFTTTSVDDFLVTVEPMKYPNITKKELTLDLVARVLLDMDEVDSKEDEDDKDDRRLGPTANIFTA